LWYALRDLDKLFWLRALLGIISGLASGLFATSVDVSWRGALIALLMYFISYYLARYILRIDVAGKKTKLFTTGIGSFIALWLFLWIIFHTLSQTLSLYQPIV
jgi:hypothetical protein